MRLAVVDYLNYCRIVGCRFFAYSTLEHCMRNHSAAGEQNRSVMVGQSGGKNSGFPIST